MPDNPPAPANARSAIRQMPPANPLTLPAICQTGYGIPAVARDRIRDPWGILANPPTQCVAVAGGVTTDCFSRAVTRGIMVEGTASVVYQARFGAYVRQNPDPTLPSDGFGRDLAMPDLAMPAPEVIAPDWRDVISKPPTGASAAGADAALGAMLGK
jgi:hypothetical protein